MSQHHSFDIYLAKKYGVNEAILIHHFEHWISVNRKLKRNFKEGRTWTYQTRAEITAHYPYLSEKQIRGALDRLVKKKILLKGNFNKTKFDRTVWYAFADESIFLNNFYDGTKGPMEKNKRANQISEKGQTIPNSKTDPLTFSSSSVSSPQDEENLAAPTKEEEEEISKIFSERNQNKKLPKIVSKKKWDQQVLKEIRLKKSEEVQRKRNSEALVEANRQRLLEEEKELKALREERKKKGSRKTR